MKGNLLENKNNRDKAENLRPFKIYRRFVVVVVVLIKVYNLYNARECIYTDACVNKTKTYQPPQEMLRMQTLGFSICQIRYSYLV